MNGRGWVGRAVLAACLVAGVAGPARALDGRTVREIERADDGKQLAELAAEVARDAAARKVASAEDGIRLAAETNTYLLFILTRQQELLLQAELRDDD